MDLQNIGVIITIILFAKKGSEGWYRSIMNKETELKHLIVLKMRTLSSAEPLTKKTMAEMENILRVWNAFHVAKDNHEDYILLIGIATLLSYVMSELLKISNYALSVMLLLLAGYLGLLIVVLFLSLWYQKKTISKFLGEV